MKSITNKRYQITNAYVEMNAIETTTTLRYFKAKPVLVGLFVVKVCYRYKTKCKIKISLMGRDKVFLPLINVLRNPSMVCVSHFLYREMEALTLDCCT